MDLAITDLISIPEVGGGGYLCNFLSAKVFAVIGYRRKAIIGMLESPDVSDVYLAFGSLHSTGGEKRIQQESRENVLRCKEMAMSAHVGGVHGARRHAGDRRTEVLLWLSTVEWIVTLVLGLLLVQFQ